MSTDNQRFYEAIASDYEAIYADVDAEEAVRQWLDLLERERLVPPRPARDVHPPRLLDVGCGPGWHAVHWARAGFEVTCLDSSATMLELARQRLAQEGARAAFLHCPVEDLRPGSLPMPPVDVVVAHFNFLNLFAPEALPGVLAAIAHGMVDGGLLVADCFIGERYSAAPLERRGQWTRTVAAGDEHSQVAEWTRGAKRLTEHWWLLPEEAARRALRQSGWIDSRLMRWSPDAGVFVPGPMDSEEPTKVLLSARRGTRFAGGR